MNVCIISLHFSKSSFLSFPLLDKSFARVFTDPLKINSEVQNEGKSFHDLSH